jgi:hypothetical protein
MTEGELRAAPYNYVTTAWDDEDLMGDVYSFMHTPPCELILHQIDMKFSELINLVHSQPKEGEGNH